MQIKIPLPIVELSIEHNPHKTRGISIKEFFECFDYDPENWISQESYIKAKDMDEIWQMIWYPDTTDAHWVYFADNLTDLMNFSVEQFCREDK